MFEHHRYLDRYRALRAAQDGAANVGTVVGTRGLQALILASSWPHRTTDYATVLLRLPEISNDLEVVRLL